MRLRGLFAGVIACAVMICQGFAQQPPAQTAQPPVPNPQSPVPSSQSQQTSPETNPGQQPIKVSVNEVVVPVTVTDDKGRFVSNLDQKDFQIFDEGKEQKIDFFTRERNQPVVVGFLLDLSNNSRTQWKNWESAAEGMVEEMLPDDKPEVRSRFSGYLIGFSNQAELLVDTTSDSNPIIEKLRKVKPGGGSALYDAVYKACTERKLVDGEPVDPRRVIIIIGDGNDNSSTKTLSEAIEVAQRNLVTIYGISTLYSGFTSAGSDNLVRLAEETGGRVEYPLNNPYKDINGYLSTPRDEGNYAIQPGTGGYSSAVSSAIFNSVANIVGEVTTQYILRYVPDFAAQDSTKAYRAINVKVALPTVKVRARKGYYPNNP
ncbi:MAG TPA: VWA domain-containing protein [Bryobacteraceae bacterium]|nr:VWA domain-containing protein [Bryobacteraceae bacterium]